MSTRPLRTGATSRDGTGGRASAMESRVVTGLMVMLLLLLAAAATSGPAGAVGACVVALLLVMLATLGRERMTVVALAGSFATAPMYRGIGGFGDVATPTDILLLLGLFLLAPELLRRQGRMPATYVLSLWVLLGTGLLGSAVNAAPVASVVFVLQWLLCIGVFPIALVMWRPSRAVVNGLLWSYLAGHMVSMAVAVAEGPLGGTGRYDGLAHHPNDFGFAGGVSVAIVLYLFWSHRATQPRVLLVGIGCLSLASVVMSGSRGVTLAVAVVILLVPVVERSGVWASLVGVACALGLALLPYLLKVGGQGGSLGRLRGDSTAQTSDSLRETGLENGWNRFLHSPFIGNGIDAEIATYHNVFLEAAVALGIFGLVAYVAICFVFARPVFGRHPLRRLSYIPWTFIVAGTTFPGLVDRTVAVPMAVAIFASVEPLRARTQDPAEVEQGSAL